jgi:serine protease inhibitor
MTTRLFLILAAATMAACGESPTTVPITALPRALTAGEQQLVAANNRFAFSLFREIARQEPAETNLFISPVSVAMALGMTVNGAAGTTRDSMLRALELSGLSMAEVNAGYRGVIDLLRGLDGGVEFTLANSIWYRTGITVGQPFLDDTRTWFDADVRSLGFASPTAAQTINDWVSAQTRGKIPEIVASPIPADVIMYLINAIYFKGSWTQRFDPALTRAAPFNLRGGGSVAVPTMEHGRKAPARIHIGAAGDVTVVDLPYGGGAWAMTIVLPAAASGIDSLASDLTQARWDGWIASLDSADVFVTMPKFTLRWELQLKDVLSALGMGIAFSCGDADFTPLFPAGGRQTCITRVKHKTFVDVNEEGTVAAAVTSVEMGITSAPQELRVVVDRPFLVAIRERLTGTVLFLGRVMNPVAS